jgi:hypothetical protein
MSYGRHPLKEKTMAFDPIKQTKIILDIDKSLYKEYDKICQKTKTKKLGSLSRVVDRYMSECVRITKK